MTFISFYPLAPEDVKVKVKPSFIHSHTTGGSKLFFLYTFPVNIRNILHNLQGRWHFFLTKSSIRIYLTWVKTFLWSCVLDLPQVTQDWKYFLLFLFHFSKKFTYHFFSNSNYFLLQILITFFEKYSYPLPRKKR